MAANENIEWYSGYPVFIATKTWQRRKHRKKRINKKWLKRYGVYEYNMMPHGEIVMMDNGAIWMTKRTFENLRIPIRQRVRGKNDKRRSDSDIKG